jgi:type I restriction enzyme S subunit
LDDKIELNQRMNETLEAMTRALFKSWFVDFDPVRAKMAGRRPAGMDQATADLFPDSFQDSPLGKIPKGWRVARLSEHVEAIKGLSYKGAGLSDTGVPLHNLNSVYEGGGYKFEGIKHYVGEYRDRHIIRPDDLIVTNTEQGHDCLLIGYAAIVPRMFGDWGLFSHHIYRVRPLDGSPVTESYLCYLLNSPAMHDTVSGYGNGTTVNMLPVAGLQHPQFLLPPSEPIQKFSDFATHVLGRRERMVTENRTLAALRDALLPKLLSGEIRVSGAEHKTRGLRQ